jgi:hypothetical protein
LETTISASPKGGLAGAKGQDAANARSAQEILLKTKAILAATGKTNHTIEFIMY